MLIYLVILIAIVTMLTLALVTIGHGLGKHHSANSPLGYEAKRLINLSYWLGTFDLALVFFACGLWLLNQW